MYEGIITLLSFPLPYKHFLKLCLFGQPVLIFFTVGLLERPVIIESGKREKRKVERLEMTGAITPNLQKKKVEVPEGTGTKLGDCPRSKSLLSSAVIIVVVKPFVVFCKKEQLSVVLLHISFFI